jgi:hypothetical protein
MTHARSLPPRLRTSGQPRMFSMPNALLPTFLPAFLGTPPPLPALPLRPLARLPPAFLTAVTRHRMRRPKSLSASLQQTRPASRRPASRGSALLLLALISLTSCSILTGAHGRARSRKAQVSEGMAVLSEASSSSFRLSSGKYSLREELYQLRRVGDIFTAIHSRCPGSLWSVTMAHCFAAADRILGNRTQSYAKHSMQLPGYASSLASVCGQKSTQTD